MSEIVWILIVVAALAALGFAAWGIHRHQYVKQLRERGWTFVTSPSIGIVYGLNVPPFGMGFKRSVDDQILGRASDGTGFSAFRYKCSQWKSDGYVVTMPLPRPLQPAEIFRTAAPTLSLPGQTMVLGDLTAAAGDAGYAQALVEAAATPLQGPFRVTVDHDRLVLVDAPKPAEELAAAVEQLAALRSRLLASPAATFVGPAAPPSLSFYQRPGWTYVPRDDSYLALLDHTGGGRRHEAHDVIYSDNDGLPFLRLRHEWETTHTRTDSEGRTRTETRHHSEELCEFRTTFPFHALSVNWELFGAAQKFEWEEFNRRYKVRSSAPRFASDVIHQRQMEYLMGCGAPKFAVAGDRILVGGGGSWYPEDIDAASRFLHGFFARVPDHVWRQLGAWPRPIAELAYDA